MPDVRFCTECGMRKAPIRADDLEQFPARLSPKQRRICVLVCNGLINKEIATRMGLSEHAVKNSLCAIFQNVGVDDKTALLIRLMKFKYEGV